jgi:hypothetical protein
MATVSVSENAVAVSLTTKEVLAGLRRDIRVPLSAVTAAEVVQDPVANVHGVRAPGLSVPNRTKIGTWRRRGRRMFAVARPGQAAVKISLAGAGVDEVLVSTPDAPALAHRIRNAVGAERGIVNYRDEPVSFAAADGVRLRGTMTIPDSGDGPFPAVLILPGSGEVDRDGDHRRIALGVGRDIANALALHGIASLRYDKRGVGESEGAFLTTGFTDNLADARAALSCLLGRPEVRSGAVVVLGHSEGALHAAEIGAQDGQNLAGVVLICPTAKTGEQAMQWQTEQVAAGLPAPTRALLRFLRIDVVAKQRKAVDTIRRTTTDTARLQGRRVNARWQRELLAYDPAPALRQLRTPVLAVTGSKDIQVDPADLQVIATLVPGPVETVTVPDLTHLLRRDPHSPSVSAYKSLARQPIDAATVELIVDWVTRHADTRGTAGTDEGAHS